MRYLILDQEKLDQLWAMYAKRRKIVGGVSLSEVIMLDKLSSRFATGTYGNRIPVDDLEYRQIKDLLTATGIVYERPVVEETD